MKKILAVFTGGTIGSRLGSDGRIAPHQDMPYRLIEWYEKQVGEDICFIIDEPYYILSENLDAMHLNMLIRCVKEHLAEGGIDGILIMHGTDTLQYSAAVLGYIFGAADIPIVLVSSDFPLEDGRANGYTNFQYAVQFVMGAYGNGVFVSYCNPGDVPTIHRGTRLLAHPAYSSAVESVAGSRYGVFRQGKYIPNAGYEAENTLPAMFGPEGAFLKQDAQEILRIVPYVGMVYPKIGRETRVVLHESFHSGTIAISEGLKAFAARAAELGIPIYLMGLPASEAEYETVGMYRELGIQPLRQGAPIAQYCKLWLALSNGIEVEEMMKVSIAEEYV